MLEDTHNDVAVSNGKVIIQASPGRKTIYAVTAGELFTPVQDMTLDNFESEIFDSTLPQLKKDDGFVMAGKTEIGAIQNSSSPLNIPESNRFTINLERLVAKVQVKADGLTLPSELGFANLIETSFKVFQTNDEMRLVSDGTPVRTSFADEASPAGTYDTYTFDNQASAYLPVQTKSFQPDGCQYMSENIVAEPKSGNTTFVCVRLRAVPTELYVMGGNNIPNPEPNYNFSNPPTFYVYALMSPDGNIVDFYRGSKREIICIADKQSADQYKASHPELGNEVSGYSYKLLCYENATVYYRINIADDSAADLSSKYRILRNRFYKIQLNSLSRLGAPSESMLAPADAGASLEGETSAGSWADATFNVTKWSEVDQTVENL